MSTIDAERTIILALRVAAEAYEIAKNLQALLNVMEALGQLEDGTLRIEQSTRAVTDMQRQTMMVAALREAGAVYAQNAADRKLGARFRALAERQAAEVRAISSRLNRGELHIVQSARS